MSEPRTSFYDWLWEKGYEAGWATHTAATSGGVTTDGLERLRAVEAAARDIVDRDPTDTDPEGLGGEWCHFCQRQTPGHEDWCDWTALRAALTAKPSPSEGEGS